MIVSHRCETLAHFFICIIGVEKLYFNIIIGNNR
jgi:hypothetical protein